MIYQIEIVFPNLSRKWSFDFSEENIQARSGRNPFANFFTSITASSFYGLLKRVKGWDYARMGGYHRQFQKIYIATNHGIIKPAEDQIEDPLNLRFAYDEVFKSIQQREVEKWGSTNGNGLMSNESKTFMMKIGNTLVRLVK